MKFLITLLLVYTISLKAKENEWLKAVVELIPHGWELNKTTCKNIKRKVSFHKEQDAYYLYGNNNHFYAWCSKEDKKFTIIKFFNNKYFKRLNLDKTKGSLFEQSAQYYDVVEDDFKIDYYNSGEVYRHEIYYNDNILIFISSDMITIQFDDSDF